MKRNSLKIGFYFPRLLSSVKNKKEIVDLIISAMRSSGDIKYAGYLSESVWHRDLLRHIGKGDILPKKAFTKKQRDIIKKNISVTVGRCSRVLSHPTPPIFVFIYPWFPTKSDSILFGGSMAFAAYRTIHLFVDLDSYTQTSLKQTIAHEWNHLVFYRHHPKRRYALRDHMVMEGLAEVFREEIMGGKPAPWAVALSQKEVDEQLKKLQGKLNSTNMRFYRSIFFGDEEYKRWTGYSVGYRIIKGFRRKNKKLSWEEVVKIDPKNIFQ